MICYHAVAAISDTINAVTTSYFVGAGFGVSLMTNAALVI